MSSFESIITTAINLATTGSTESLCTQAPPTAAQRPLPPERRGLSHRSSAHTTISLPDSGKFEFSPQYVFLYFLFLYKIIPVQC